ncbi:MAG: site-specific integrase [Paracoccaceae bacterium]|nr:site-specific integrase [Paracoccaceae bacterium]
MRLRTVVGEDSVASFRKLPSGAWRAEVSKNGIRKSNSFPTRAEAREWAARQEYLIGTGEGQGSTQTFGDVMDRYARERSPKKRGAHWEIIRLERFQRDDIARIRMCDLTPGHFAQWRDRRLGEVAPASVIRELQLMSSVLTVARSEWGLISANPISEIRKPTKPPPRDRLPTAAEIERIRHAAGEDLSFVQARAFHAFLFSIETAMRAGEIAGLTWDRVDLKRRVVQLQHTKNGRPRAVPLSSEAVRLIEALPKMDPVFGIQSRQLDVLWRRARDRAGVDGLTFHDARAEAITRLAKKLDILDLARMVGHSDLKMLQVYYRDDAETIARRLD